MRFIKVKAQVELGTAFKDVMINPSAISDVLPVDNWYGTSPAGRHNYVRVSTGSGNIYYLTEQDFTKLVNRIGITIEDIT